MQLSRLSQRTVPAGVVWLVVLALAVLAGQWLQSHVHLNHDVSYFVHFDRWLLQGRSLGADLLDGNLPMVWLLFMPAAGLVEAGWLGEAAAVRLVFWLYTLLALALMLAVLARLHESKGAASTGWIVAFVLVATLAPGFSFGQREHACVLFAMPYLASAVARLEGRELPRALALGIGLLAGVGFSIKPYFLAVPAAVELVLLARLGWRSLIARAESLVLAFTVLAYVVACALMLGDYLAYMLALLDSTYWAYDSLNTAVVVERFLDVARPLLYGLVMVLVARTWTPHSTVLLAATIGFAVSYFVQWKGFGYHAYPVLVCAVSFLGVSVGQSWSHLRAGPDGLYGRLRPVVLAGVLILALPTIKYVHDDVARWYFTYNFGWGRIGVLRQTVIDVVNELAPLRGAYFFALTTHPFPGFPTASYTNADWSGRVIVQSVIPAYARIDEVSDPDTRRKVIRAAEEQRRMVVEDFQRRPPSVVFVERQRARLGMNGRWFDDIAFYREDPAFSRIWEDYVEYQPLGPLRVFVLRRAERQQ